MRINLSFVNAYLVDELNNASTRLDVTANGVDIIMVRLASGESVAIHLVERDIDVGLIRSVLEKNAQSKVATLFILWCAMLLPDDGTLYPPYDWMSALVALYDGKIYGYEGYGSDICIFPVHFERQTVGLEYRIRYGDNVDIGKLGTETVHTQMQQIAGFWRVADFCGPVRQQKQNKHENQSYTRARPDRNPMSVYYDILGLGIGADVDAIKQAYHQLARQYHPDVNKTPDATERMQQINMAYTHIMAQRDLNL